jgi:cytochrome P450
MAYFRVLVGVIETAIFGAAIWPLARILADHGFRQKLRVFPAVAVLIVGSLTGYVILLILLGRYFSAALSPIALMIGGALIYGWRRARPDYGRARGLPPGSLALAPIGPWNDYLFYQKQAERYGPVFKMSHFTAPMVCVVGLKSAIDLLRERDEDLTVPPLPFNRFIPGGFLRYMDASAHQRYAAIFRATFTRAVIEENEPHVVAVVSRAFFEMAKACASSPDRGIRPESRVRSALFVVFARLFFGLPPDGERMRRMQTLYDVIDYRNAWRTPGHRVSRALDELLTIVKSSGEHASGCFLAEALRAEPSVLRDRTFVLNMLYMLLTGWGDVSGLLVWVIKKLSDHPEWAERLRQEFVSPNPDTGGADGLASRIVRETLRLEQSEYLMRKTKREIRIGDYVIPRGWHLRVCVRESHRSEDAFADAAAFNPDRFLSEGSPRASYSPFGASRIACMGEHLTLAVGRVFLKELVREFNWNVTRDGPREYGSFHWKPNSRFSITLWPRE